MKIRFLIWLVFIVPVAHAQSGSVVFGSYTQTRYADEAIRRVGERLDIRATTLRTEVGGNTYLRVVSPPMAEAAGRCQNSELQTPELETPKFGTNTKMSFRHLKFEVLKFKV